MSLFDPSVLNRLLVIATRQIGDVLLTTPLIRSLRLAYPNTQIDVLTYENTDGMLVGNPDIHHVLCVAEHPNTREYRQLLKQILRCYDLAISTLSGDRPLLYALLAAPKRIGPVPPWRVHDWWKRPILHAWTDQEDENTHTLHRHLRLADLLGIPRHYDPVPPRDYHGEKVLDPIMPFSWRETPFVVLHVSPMWRYKHWRIDGWRALVHSLERRGLRVVMTGGPSPAEQTYVRHILEGSGTHTVNLVGQLRIAEVAEVLRVARLYVGPDTAMTHLAASLGIPTVALYGPSNPVLWGPWPRGFVSDSSPYQHRAPHQRVGNVLLIQPEKECVPCFQEGCDRHKGSTSTCLETLPIARVIDATLEMLPSLGKMDT